MLKLIGKTLRKTGDLLSILLCKIFSLKCLLITAVMITYVPTFFDTPPPKRCSLIPCPREWARPCNSSVRNRKWQGEDSDFQWETGHNPVFTKRSWFISSRKSFWYLMRGEVKGTSALWQSSPELQSGHGKHQTHLNQRHCSQPRYFSELASSWKTRKDWETVTRRY